MAGRQSDCVVADISAAEVAIFCKALISEIESAAYFRWERVRRFPDDARNERSASALDSLARNLMALPDDDSRLRDCFALYKTRHHEAGSIGKWDTWLTPHDLEFPSDMDEPTQDKRIFLQYGFHTREDGNAEDFLCELQEQIEDWEPEFLDFDRWADGY